VFADIAKYTGMARPISPLFNAVRKTGIIRWLQRRLLGVSSQRILPPITRKPFVIDRDRVTVQERSEVVLFIDTFTKFTEPELGSAAVAVLEAAGFSVLEAKGQGCCGRPMISKGLLAQAKTAAENNMAALMPYVEQGIPIVGLEPSCLLSMRDEYLDFFPHDPRARALANHAFMIEEFLISRNGKNRAPIERLQLRKPARSLTLHGHCHMKSLVGIDPTLEMLRATGAKVQEIDSGCCGMAGSFGYEAEHYDLSMQIGELILFPEVRKASQGNIEVVAHGTSCRTQIADGTGTEVHHPIQVLAAALD
jgi:Fe-S oxidoreductase